MYQYKMDDVLLHLEHIHALAQPYLKKAGVFLNELRIDVNRHLDKFESWQIVAMTLVLATVLVQLNGIYDRFVKLNGNGSLGKALKLWGFRISKKLPIVSYFVGKEIDKTSNSIMKELYKPFKDQVFQETLPEKGVKPEKILSTVDHYGCLTSVAWEEGFVSGGIYTDFSNNEYKKLIKEVYGKTAFTNPLHADIFPGIRKMEAEIVRISCNLFNGDADSCGCVTTGGTESIIMACKAYRDYALQERGIDEPEMVLPVTAHAGFDKGAEYLKIKMVHIPVDPKTMKVNIRAMRAAITKNTIMLVGSTPNFPNGIIDPIEEIAKLGYKYNVPVHVDGCLGGFLIPFMKEAGYEIPTVDFSLRGVTSISADTHKYGYSPKGSSVLMYKHPKYRQCQYSVVTDWPGGVYASPTVSGSRAGGNIATCWAALMYHGHAGYLDAVKKVMKATRYMKKELVKVNGIFLYGDPLMSVIAIGSNDFSILEMGDKLTAKGWNLNTLQFPAGIHICTTLMHTGSRVADRLVKDVRQVAAELLDAPKSKKKLTGQAAVYGMAQSLPDRSLIGDIAKVYLNAYYCTDWSNFE
ncbi:Sphingosine-1-phosphate lyase 1 [Halotydeus destructor]|nr:Sphingosine-1-phosphate lyase 1 [Halotydeus destructor]